jgi:hypothetical protein
MGGVRTTGRGNSSPTGKGKSGQRLGCDPDRAVPVAEEGTHAIFPGIEHDTTRSLRDKISHEVITSGSGCAVEST